MVISGFIFTVISHGSAIDYVGFLRNRLVHLSAVCVRGVPDPVAGTWNEHLNYGALTWLEWLLPLRASTVSQNPHFVQLWTIWVECQFYLMFPFLKAFADRHGVRYLVGWILLLDRLRTGIFVLYGSVRFIAYESIRGSISS
jgi:peptidoglycan/LPS O-acetylase OafA/YrhL